MFFVRKENIGTTLGTQKEFTAAQRRGIQFFSSPTAEADHKVWHYLFSADKIEPSLRESLDPAAAAHHFVWSQEVATGTTIGEPLITPFVQDEDALIEDSSGEQSTAGWEAKAAALWAAHVAATAGQTA